ncbi:hypothetical protein [Pseudooceanicola sp. MF1-13]|uniref:hypothetical protein n=1 Tax=Pseudooceanicola sp. MF1-13 TaxID=3379095 RepID=UPI0038922932
MSNPTPKTSPLYDLPIIGWIARKAGQDGDARIFLSLVLALVLVAGAVANWGVIALGLIALAAVPVMFVILLMLTVGK